MVSNKKTTDLVKKIILLLIFVFLSNLYYLYFKKNQKEPFVYHNYNTNVDASAVNFLSDPYDYDPDGITISAPYNNNDIKITSLTRAVDFALSDKSKNFQTSQGKPTKFPINTIVKKDCDTKGEEDNNAVPCMYKPESVAFGYDVLPITNTSSQHPDIRKDSDPNIYLDNYDQIDKIIEREKIDKNYTQKTLDNANTLTLNDGATVLSKTDIYNLRDENDTNINRRGAVEVAYSRKEELNNTKNKYNIENIRNNSVNLQYIFLFCVILASIIVLGLYYISFISNSVLIIYIILVILVIYFFNIINIIN